MPPTPAKHLGLTAKEAWALFESVRPDMYRREELLKMRRQDGKMLRRIRVGTRFTASELHHRWRIYVSGMLERALWAGILTYDGRVGCERIYRRVK